jgi:hypothetical protein
MAIACGTGCVPQASSWGGRFSGHWLRVIGLDKLELSNRPL